MARTSWRPRRPKSREISTLVEAVELATWQSFEHDGLRVTAVPVDHNGMRYGIDRAWMTTGFPDT